ncbi:MAG TPA: hypothetical protein VLM79_06710 [Kofleriaceae bacterium]|nr:hypothetical protein [Kofleriaceae bacterium]
MGSRVARLGALCASLLACACTKTDGGDVGPPPGGPRSGSPGSGGSGGASGSGSSGASTGGFSADLAKDIGPGSAARTDGAKPSGSTSGATGSEATAQEPAASPPSAVPEVPKAASASERDLPRPASGAAAAGDPSDPPKASSSSSSASTDPSKAASAAAGTPSEPAARTASSSAPSGASRDAVKVPTDLAAIKISLLPNWDRDVGAAGTFQYVVRVKGTQSTKTFVFHYGYDDPRAPTDRDQYKKYLHESKLLVGEIKDRQRGSAWFLEGADASGLPAFRYVVLYGGKHLICYGSLYKDAESSRLGDDRDQTVIQAKQICETLAL